MAEHRFELLIDGVPYSVDATPFEFNSETRYKIGYGGKEYIFAYDTQVNRLIAIDDEASDIPDNLEEAISDKLMSGPRPV